MLKAVGTMFPEFSWLPNHLNNQPQYVFVAFREPSLKGRQNNAPVVPFVGRLTCQAHRCRTTDTIVSLDSAHDRIVVCVLPQA